MYVSEEKMCLVRVYVRAACLGFQFKELLITRVMQITGIGLLRQNASEPNFEDISSERTAIDKPREPDSYVDELNLFAVKYWFSWITSGTRRGKSNYKFWKSSDEYLETLSETSGDGKGSKLSSHDVNVEREEPYETFSMFSKQSVRALILQFFRKWHRRLSFIWKHGTRCLGTLWVCVWWISLVQSITFHVSGLSLKLSCSCFLGMSLAFFFFKYMSNMSTD